MVAGRPTTDRLTDQRTLIAPELDTGLDTEPSRMPGLGWVSKPFVSPDINLSLSGGFDADG